MKKVITIHINHVLFQIEEDGFNMINESLYRQGKYGDNATEALIAEKFATLVSPNKQVITIADVQSVLTQLGLMGYYGSSQSGQYEYNHSPKRLFRNTSDRVVGGVCSGMGEYWNIDPVLVRVLFIASFFGFGVGLFIYLILWIILPKKQ